MRRRRWVCDAGRGVARLKSRIQRRRERRERARVWQSRSAGMEGFFEALHEFLRDRDGDHRRGQGRVQYHHRVPHRARPPTAVAEESATRQPAAGSAGRSLGQRSGAAAEGCCRAAGGRHFRRDPASSSRDRPRHPAHPGATHPYLAGAKRRRSRRHFWLGASAGPVGALRFHRHGRPRHQHRRRPARSSAVTFSPGLLGMGARPRRARRRELCGLGRRPAECLVGAPPGAAGASQQQSVGRLSQISTRRPARTRPSATRHCARITACSPPATITAWRMRIDREPARPSEAGDRGCALGKSPGLLPGGGGGPPSLFNLSPRPARLSRTGRGARCRAAL